MSHTPKEEFDLAANRLKRFSIISSIKSMFASGLVSKPHEDFYSNIAKILQPIADQTTIGMEKQADKLALRLLHSFCTAVNVNDKDDKKAKIHARLLKVINIGVENSTIKDIINKAIEHHDTIDPSVESATRSWEATVPSESTAAVARFKDIQRGQKYIFLTPNDTTASAKPLNLPKPAEEKLPEDGEALTRLVKKNNSVCPEFLAEWIENYPHSQVEMMVDCACQGGQLGPRESNSDAFFAPLPTAVRVVFDKDKMTLKSSTVCVNSGTQRRVSSMSYLH